MHAGGTVARGPAPPGTPRAEGSWQRRPDFVDASDKVATADPYAEEMLLRCSGRSIRADTPNGPGVLGSMSLVRIRWIRGARNTAPTHQANPAAEMARTGSDNSTSDATKRPDLFT